MADAQADLNITDASLANGGVSSGAIVQSIAEGQLSAGSVQGASGGSAASASVSTMQELQSKYPDFYKLLMMSIAQIVKQQMQDSQDRITQIIKDARSADS